MAGRLNLPFVGICTFGKWPYVARLGRDRRRRRGARRAVRLRHAVAGRRALRAARRSARPRRCSPSATPAPTTTRTTSSTCRPGRPASSISATPTSSTPTRSSSHANIESGVRKILEAGALPVVLGGDHSINIPCIAAFEGQAPIHIVQIDAHLDFVDERHGVRYGHGNPMRRAAEKPYVTGLTQIGIRNVSSTAARATRMPAGWARTSSRSARSASSASRRVLARIPAGDALLRHDRHRRLRSLDRAGHRHAAPWRLPLLRGAGAAGRPGEARHGRRHRPRRGRARLRPHRHDGDSRRADPDELHRPHPARPRLRGQDVTTPLAGRARPRDGRRQRHRAGVGRWRSPPPERGRRSRPRRRRRRHRFPMVTRRPPRRGGGHRGGRRRGAPAGRASTFSSTSPASCRRAPIEAVTAEHVALHFDVNVRGTILVDPRGAEGHAGRADGSSTSPPNSPRSAAQNASVYVATKAAVVGLTRSWARELALARHPRQRRRARTDRYAAARLRRSDDGAEGAGTHPAARAARPARRGRRRASSSSPGRAAPSSPATRSPSNGGAAMS